MSPVLPLSIIIPESFAFVDEPRLSPIMLSDTSRLVWLTVVVIPLTCKSPAIVTRPEAPTLTLSAPPVSIVNISLDGNLKAVPESPLCIILSVIAISPLNNAPLLNVAYPTVGCNESAFFPPTAISKLLEFWTSMYAASEVEFVYIPPPPLPTNPIFNSSLLEVDAVLTSCFNFRTWPPLVLTVLFVSRATTKAISSVEVNKPEPTTRNASFGIPPPAVCPPTTCNAETGLL